jgi:hypothetical protein
VCVCVCAPLVSVDGCLLTYTYSRTHTHIRTNRKSANMRDRVFVCVCVILMKAALISKMTVFFFSKKKTQVRSPGPKRTASVFVLSVWYQYSFFCAKKRQSLWKSDYCLVILANTNTHTLNLDSHTHDSVKCSDYPPCMPVQWQGAQPTCRLGCGSQSASSRRSKGKKQLWLSLREQFRPRLVILDPAPP